MKKLNTTRRGFLTGSLAAVAATTTAGKASAFFANGKGGERLDQPLNRIAEHDVLYNSATAWEMGTDKSGIHSL